MQSPLICPMRGRRVPWNVLVVQLRDTDGITVSVKGEVILGAPESESQRTASAAVPKAPGFRDKDNGPSKVTRTNLLFQSPGSLTGVPR